MPDLTSNEAQWESWLDALNDPATSITLVHSNVVRQPAGWHGIDEIMPDHLIFFVEQGVIDGFVSSETVSLRSGDTVWIPPNTRRLFRCARTAGRALTRRIRIRVLPSDHRTPLAPPCLPMVRRDAWDLVPYLELFRGLTARAATPRDRELRALLTGLAVRLRGLPTRTPSEAGGLTAVQRHQLEQLIDRELETLAPAAMAEGLRLTHDYFSRVFKRSYGVSPRTFIKRERMRHAAQLLTESSLSIKEFCRESGNTDVSKFCRQFRQVHGCTPTAYREMHARGSEG